MTLLELDAVSYRYADGGLGLEHCSLAIERGSRNADRRQRRHKDDAVQSTATGCCARRPDSFVTPGGALDYGRAGMRELRSRVGLVFQNPDHQLFSASVAESVSFGPVNLRTRPGHCAPARRRIARRGGHGRARRQGGAQPLLRPEEARLHRRRAGHGARLLILDEPMAGLDQRMRSELLAVLDGLHAQGITLLLATHDIDFAYRWAQRVHLIDEGACTASLDGADLAHADAALTSLDLPLPAVVELHRRRWRKTCFRPSRSRAAMANCWNCWRGLNRKIMRRVRKCLRNASMEKIVIPAQAGIQSAALDSGSSPERVT